MFIDLFRRVIKRAAGLVAMPFYAVARGRVAGVFATWPECEAQVKGFSGARYKKFDTEQLARAFVAAEGAQAPRARAAAKRKLSPSGDDQLEAALNEHMDRFESKLRAFESGIAKIAKSGGGGGGGERRAILLEQPPPSASAAAAAAVPGGWQVDAEGFVRVWTDGSCLANGRSGARAGLGVWWGEGHEANAAQAVQGRATNNAGELQAAALALQLARQHGLRRVAVHTDSRFLVDAVTRWMPRWRREGWRKADGAPVRNEDDFRRLHDAMAGLDVRWTHVPAHSGHEGNEAADALARQGALLYRGTDDTEGTP